MRFRRWRWVRARAFEALLGQRRAQCSRFLHGGETRTAPSKIELKLRDEEERLKMFNVMFNDVRIGAWLETSSSAKKTFIKSERVTCKCCNSTKQFVKISDVRSHDEGSTHKKKVDALAAAARLKQKRMAALGVEIVKKSDLVPHEVAARARSAAHGLLISLGCNPTLIQRIFSSGVIDAS